MFTCIGQLLVRHQRLQGDEFDLGYQLNKHLVHAYFARDGPRDRLVGA